MNITFPLAKATHTKNYHWFVVATVCIGAFMAALDASIINIALPTLERTFHVSMNQIEWVSLAYLLALASFILIFGRLADLFGRRWLYAGGFLVFIISSLFCGLASSLPGLIFARIFQGIGAAMLQANSVSIITAATPAEDRGKAIGFQASAQGIGLSLGPVLGGTLLQLLSWKWLFFINVPIGLIGTAIGVLLLPKDALPKRKEAFDFYGALFLIPFLIALIYLLNMGLKAGWTSPSILFCFVVAVISFTVFFVIEQRVKDPLLDLSLFKNISFSLGNLTGMLSFAVMYAVLLLIPYYLEHIKGLTPFQSGLLITIIPLGMTLSTPIAGHLSDQRGARLPMLLGLIGTTLGCLILLFLNLKGSCILLGLGIFCIGLGLGTFTPPNNSNVMGHTPRHRLGIAGGILNMARTLGMGLGVTFGGLTYQIFLLAFKIKDVKQSASAFTSTFFVVMLLSALTLGITWYSQRRREID
jgi:EmrB/QacA subfamily drug resistance transporter